jgi:hypothetical protein
MSRTLHAMSFALAVLASSVDAQSGSRIGLGVTLNPVAVAEIDMESSFLPIGLGNFTVPIQLGSRVRVEPELGIYKFNAEFEGSGFNGNFESSILRYGAGVHFLVGGTDEFRPYVGPRFGFIKQSNRQENTGSATQEEKRTDTYIGLVVGGEYFLTSRFSLGGEVQLNRVGMGDEEDSGTPSPSDTSVSFISSNGVISVRFYL